MSGDYDYFIILDRLHITLGEKIKKWRMTKRLHQGLLDWMNKYNVKLRSAVKMRFFIGYEIGCALEYLHAHKYVF